MHRKFGVKFGGEFLKTDRQTDKQTDWLIAIRHSPTGGGVK